VNVHFRNQAIHQLFYALKIVSSSDFLTIQHIELPVRNRYVYLSNYYIKALFTLLNTRTQIE